MAKLPIFHQLIMWPWVEHMNQNYDTLAIDREWYRLPLGGFSNSWRRVLKKYIILMKICGNNSYFKRLPKIRRFRFALFKIWFKMLFMLQIIKDLGRRCEIFHSEKNLKIGAIIKTFKFGQIVASDLIFSL